MTEVITASAIAVAAVLAAVLIVRAPHWGVIAIFTLWFIKFDVTGGATFLGLGPTLIVCLLLIPFAAGALQDREIRALRVPQLQIAIALQLLFLLSTWWAEFAGHAVALPGQDQTGRVLHVALARLVFLALLLTFVDTAHRIRTFVWVVVGLIVAAALSAALPFLSGEVARARAAFGMAANPNRLGFVCLFALSIVWFHRAYAGSRSVLSLPLVVLLPIVALGTASRSTLIALVVLGALIIADQKHWSPARRAQCVVLIGCVALVAVLVVSQFQFLRATTFDPVLTAPGGKSLVNRLLVVKEAALVALENPVIGIGIGNFPTMHRSLFGTPVKPHNSYLGTLAEGGVGTLALYLVMFGITYRMLRELCARGPDDLRWLAKALRANLIVFLLYSAFADLWLSEFLYLLVGLTAAMAYRWRRSPAVVPRPAPHLAWRSA